jgi:peptide deformylase
MKNNMSVRDILVYPHKILQKRAEEIKDINSEIVKLVNDMVATMYAAPGVGLAAPQVAQSKRLIVVDISAKDDSGELITIINPVISEKQGKEVGSEMCLSVPEFSIDVARATHILVKGIDLKGKEISLEASGFLARVIQHEMDHLDGTVILSYASSLKKSIYLRKREKAKQ